MTKLCIATATYFHPRETHVAFHIQNLFGGNVCILHEKDYESSPFQVPHHAWMTKGHGRSTALSRVSSAASTIANIAKHRTTKAPNQGQRAGILEFFEQEKPDAVLAEFGTVALRIAPVMRDLNLPFFTYFRGADASSHLRQPLRAEGYRRMMPALDGVFAVAQFLLDELAAHGIQHVNSHVVPSGVNTDTFIPAQKTPGSFLAVGRFVEKKRPELTIRAFLKATENLPNAKLDMIGDGTLFEACQALVRDLNATDKVILHGAKPHAVVAEKLASSEVLLQHSVRAKDGNTEGMPMTIQEAMACGLAIVSTRHAGIPDAVDEGVNGFLVDEGDFEGFATAIERIASSPDLARSMSQINRDKAVERFDNRKLVKTVEHEIAKVIQRK
ncbi:MAG: glycosyltransferase [Pseudomonadota bacterium]